MSKRHSEIKVKPGNILRVYSMKKTLEIEKQWVNIFCKDKLGANIKAYKWHIFSFEKYPAKTGTKAQAEYALQKAPEFIILSNEDEPAVV